MNTSRRGFLGGVSAAALLSASGVAFAQKKYDDGASDTEIKIGHCCPYSGPASAYGVIGKAHQAFFKAVNEAGGINGRKVNFVTLDDGYSPPKTVEMVRQLVEQEKVLLLFQTLGTPTNTAIHKYVNQKKVPHLYISTGASKWGDPQHFPWTMGFQPDYHTEGADLRQAHAGQRQGREDRRADAERRLRQGLLSTASRRASARKPASIVKHVTYEMTDPTVDSQIIQLKDSGANVFFNIVDAEVRRPGDPQGGRDRLEAGALPDQRLGFGRLGHEARRLRQRAGHHHGGLPQGSRPTSSGTTPRT